MDCLRAQELISDALDRATRDAAELEAAKEHCRSCEECGAFVRTMLAVQKAGSPQPPADLADRVMARIRSLESARIAGDSKVVSLAAARDEVATVPSVMSSDATEAAHGRARSWGDLVRIAMHPRNRRAAVVWASAAAVLFVVAGIGAIAGVRTILTPSGTARVELTYDGAAESAAPPSMNDLDAGQDQAAGTAEEKAAAPGPDLITVDETVFRYVSTGETIDTSQLTRLGSTSSALDTERRAGTLEVLRGPDPDTAYIEADGELLSFQRVTRVYEGRTYVLKSGSLDSFGTWPTLPRGLREPTSPDGSPVFTLEGTDDNGSQIFTRRGATADRGIAIAPGPTSPDPMAGAPVWTWWEPAD